MSHPPHVVQGSPYFRSCVDFMSQRLLPMTVTELVNLAADHSPDINVSIDIQPLASFDCAVEHCSSSENVHCYKLSITAGLIIRLCFLAEIMSQAFETRRSAAIHHGSMMEPAEIAFIPSFGNGLDKLNFSLCPELMPLFLDSYEDDEHWTLLQSLDWSFKFAPDLASLPSEITHQAQHYVYHSVRFLLLHELSHILMGHLQYLEATQGLKALPEAASQRPTTDPYILKAMEFDADVNAMAMALSGGIDTERGTLGRGASFRQNPIGLFKGVAILLTSFDVSHRSTHHYKVSTHPIPDFRYILSCLFWAPKLRSLGWEDELSPVYRRSWKEALLWAKIGTEQLGIPGGAFYSVGREIFIDFRETETIIATELSPPLVPIRDGREFSLVNYADTELANIMLARARLREDLRSPYSRK